MTSNPPVEGLPPIRRARGYRLYDASGARYLDLFQDGGGAILGHRAGSALAAMKGALSCGLAAGLPSAWEARLAKALVRMFPGFPHVRLFASRARALEAASLYLGARIGQEDLHDPALSPAPPAASRAALWRPFLGPAMPAADVLLPVLPFSVCGAPAPACFRGALPEGFPGSDVLPGFILAGALRGLAALERPEGRSGPRAPSRTEIPLAGSRGWARAGPYVRPLFAAADYPRRFAEFLRARVLLSPVYPGPSILPGECSPGERELLAELFARIPGG